MPRLSFLRTSLLAALCAAATSLHPSLAKDLHAQPVEALDQPKVSEQPEGGQVATPPSPTTTTDPEELVQYFDRAIELFSQGKYAEAEAAFLEIARESVQNERRAAAAELAKQSARRILRQAPTEKPLAKPAASQDEEEGRSTYLAMTTLLGLNYGWMVPTILDVKNPRSFVGLYLLSAASSFAIPYLITKEDEITQGMSTLASAGSYVGLAHGALAYSLLSGRNGTGSQAKPRRLLASMLVSSVAEGAIGYWWAKNNAISAGHASSIATGSVVGLGYGAGLAFVVTGEEDKFRLQLGGILAGSIGGIIGGHYYDQLRSPTRGDISTATFTGLLGAYVSAVPLVIGEVDDVRILSGTLLAGATLGLLLGDTLTKEVEYSTGQSALLSLGSIAGGLVGAGSAFFVYPGDSDTAVKWVIAGSALGAMGGFYAMYNAIEPERDSGTTTAITADLTPIFGPNGEKGLGITGSF